MIAFSSNVFRLLQYPPEFPPLLMIIPVFPNRKESFALLSFFPHLMLQKLYDSSLYFFSAIHPSLFSGHGSPFSIHKSFCFSKIFVTVQPAPFVKPHCALIVAVAICPFEQEKVLQIIAKPLPPFLSCCLFFCICLEADIASLLFFCTLPIDTLQTDISLSV